MHQLGILLPGMPNPRPGSLVTIKRNLPFTVIIVYIAVEVKDGLLVVNFPSTGISAERLTVADKRAVWLKLDPSIICGIVLFGHVLIVFKYLVHKPCPDKLILGAPRLTGCRDEYNKDYVNR